MKYLYTPCGTQFQVDEIFLAGFTWRLKGGYVCGSGERYKDEYIHRVIAGRMGLDLTDLIDHKDRNPLNNQRDNLRPATHSQNAMNSKIRSCNNSGVTGVHYDELTQSWRASITTDKKINLGNSSRSIRSPQNRRDKILWRFRPWRFLIIRKSSV